MHPIPASCFMLAMIMIITREVKAFTISTRATAGYVKPCPSITRNNRLYASEAAANLFDDIGDDKSDASEMMMAAITSEVGVGDDVEEEIMTSEEDLKHELDAMFMNEAIDEAELSHSKDPFPKAWSGAVLVYHDRDRGDQIIGKGFSDFNMESIQKCFIDAGLSVTPLKDWAVSFPNRELKDIIADSCTLYLTLEPSKERNGSLLPSMTQLIEETGIGRVVVGSMDPIPENRGKGCSTLHAAGIEVIAGVEEKACDDLIKDYAERVNSKLSRRGRAHLRRTGRPLGLLHCSVIDSNDAKSFERSGNAFPRDLGGTTPLSERNFGCYEIAPPPEQIWAGTSPIEETLEDDLAEDYKKLMMMDETDDGNTFLDEDEENADITYGGLKKNPMMPWYEQVDAVIATFPKSGYGPAEDDSVMSRLTGLKWLATNDNTLPAAVERILVLDAADLALLPTSNDDPNLPPGVDVESFWDTKDRKPPRLLLRYGTNAAAANAARTAAAAAAVASNAARRAMALAESGEAEDAAEEAVKSQKAAEAALADVQKQVDKIQASKEHLQDRGVIVETIKGGEPIDVMKHLGDRNGLTSIVWRAGCWGSRGVTSILNGTFEWVSAHLAVDAVGGKFWQLMLAERCIQAACGPESKVKVLTEEDDISIEYCDTLDKDCVLKVNGRSIRHVRIDCRMAVIDPNRKRSIVGWKNSMPMALNFKEEQAPWFL